MRPLDVAAMSAARERGAPEGEVWLAGVAGDPRGPWREIAVAPERCFGPAPLSVGEVAAAVDRGRELAAAAARDGAAVLRAVEGIADPDAVARLAAWAARTADVELGPLRALRRLGDEPLAVLCGAALGAGEHGLGFVHDGAAGAAAAAVAVAVEPTLAPRVSRS